MAQKPGLVFTIPLGDKKFLTSNEVNRAGHWARAKNTRAWRDETVKQIREGIPKSRINYFAKIDMIIHKPTGRRYDPGNLYPVAKAIVDGIVLSGLLEDDDYTHVDGPHLHHGEPDKDRPGVMVIIRPISKDDSTVDISKLLSLKDNADNALIELEKSKEILDEEISYAQEKSQWAFSEPVTDSINEGMDAAKNALKKIIETVEEIDAENYTQIKGKQ